MKSLDLISTSTGYFRILIMILMKPDFCLYANRLSGISPFGGKDLEDTLSRILFDRYSTKEMYDNVTEESVKFVGKLMCRLPR